MALPQLTIKVTHQGTSQSTTKRFFAVSHEFDELAAQCHGAFGLKVPANVELRWLDEEDDIVSITNDSDLCEPLAAVLTAAVPMKLEIGRHRTADTVVAEDEPTETEVIRYDRSQIPARWWDGGDGSAPSSTGHSETAEYRTYSSARRNNLISSWRNKSAAFETVVVDGYWDKEGNRAIHLAASLGHHQVVAELLEFKADVHQQNYAGLTPLQLAQDPQFADTQHASAAAVVALIEDFIRNPEWLTLRKDAEEKHRTTVPSEGGCVLQ